MAIIIVWTVFIYLEQTFKLHENAYKNHDYYYIRMSKKDNNILRYNKGKKIYESFIYCSCWHKILA